jgi:muconolactone delta-isomerase
MSDGESSRSTSLASLSSDDTSGSGTSSSSSGSSDSGSSSSAAPRPVSGVGTKPPKATPKPSATSAAGAAAPTARAPVKKITMKTVAAVSVRPAATFVPPPVSVDGAVEIQFETPDDQLTVDPSIGVGSQGFFKGLKRTYRPWQFRCVDYFLAAVEMFVACFNKDYSDQVASCRARGADPAKMRFTWRNGGSLAENFAVAMDQTKALHAVLSANPTLKKRTPNFVVFAEVAMQHLRTESVVPESVVSDSTFKVKFKDWSAGGTRYQKSEVTESEGARHNVKFADTEARAAKVRKFLAARIDPTAGNKNAFELAMQSSSTRISIFDGTELAGTPQYVPTVRVRRASDATVAAPSGPSGMKSVQRGPTAGPSMPAGPGGVSKTEDERIDQGVRVSLHRMLNGSSIFPDSMRQSMPDFVRLSENARSYGVRKCLFEIVQKSSAAIQACFERTGGVAVAHRYVVEAMRQHNQHNFMRYLEHLAELHCAFSRETKELWTHDPFDEANNTAKAIEARKKGAGADNVPPLLSWMRTYMWKLPDGRQSVLETQYTTNLVDRLERALSGRRKRPATAPPVPQPLPPGGAATAAAARAPGTTAARPEVGGAPKALAPAAMHERLQRAVHSHVSREDQFERMTQLVASRIRADRDKAAGVSHIRRYAGFGPIISDVPGDVLAPPAPVGIVDCLCVQCCGTPESTVAYDPFRLLGIDRP